MVNGLREMSNSRCLPKFALRLRIFSNRRRHEVLAEDVFRRIFCWERKRAERSGRCFLLMLVHVESILHANQSERALSEIVSALSSSTREADLAGWYRAGAMLGVIFTEFREGDRKAMESLTSAKVTASLRSRLTPEQLEKMHISFHFFPETEDKSGFSQPADAELYPDLFERDEERRFSRFVKRSMDIAGSLATLILCSPLLVLISVAIKLTSKGPILFKQERVGRYGSRFTFLKFRSMECGSDARIHREYVKQYIAGEAEAVRASQTQNAVYKIQSDPRITRVGKFLRRSSLDELPQFINVLRGDMSLVGPRPPIPYELEGYQIWHRRRVLESKPGITGLWQVNGRSRVKFDDMVRMDLQYAKTWSLWLDVKILLQTPAAVLFGAGAY
jgi:exopolysaccharide biosynthesis polyprenyl glycosylphosphotransferase